MSLMATTKQKKSNIRLSKFSRVVAIKSGNIISQDYKAEQKIHRTDFSIH